MEDEEKVAQPQALCQVVAVHEVLLGLLEHNIPELTDEEREKCFRYAEVICWVLGHDDSPEELGHRFATFFRTLMDRALAVAAQRVADQIQDAARRAKRHRVN